MDCKLFHNGRFVSFNNGKCSVHDALVVYGEIILAIGYFTELATVYSWAEKYDLGGRVVVPGFNDAHMHFLSLLLYYHFVDLSQAHDSGYIEEMVRRRHQNTQKMVVCVNFSGGPGDNLNIEQFSYPVFVQRVCWHAALCNRAFLKYSGIVADEYTDGYSTLLEDSVSLAWERGIQLNIEIPELRVQILETMRSINSYGVTTIYSDDFGYLATLLPADMVKKGRVELADIFLEMMRDLEPQMTVRFVEYFSFRTVADYELFVRRRGQSVRKVDRYQQAAHRFTLGPCKVIADGSLGAKTAFLLADYADSAGWRGYMNFTKEELKALVYLCTQQHIQTVIHTIGDGAVEQVLEIYNACGKYEARGCLVHYYIATASHTAAVAGLGLGLIVQPVFIYSDVAFAERYVGCERLERSYQLQSLLTAKINTALSTDAPVAPLDPVLNIYCAVERAGPEHGRVLNASEGTSVLDAIYCYTYGSAWVELYEYFKGTLKALQAADFVALGPAGIQTYLGGTLVYDGCYGGDARTYKWLLDKLTVELSAL